MALVGGKTAARGELRMVGDVGGGGEVDVVTRDEDAVLREHEVGLDAVSPLSDGALVGGKGVLRPLPRGAAVGDDDRQPPAEGRRGPRRRGVTRGAGGCARDARRGDEEHGDGTAHRGGG